MFLRLRSRGVSVLITYQAHITLKRVYGDAAAENIGQCTNVIYLRQADVESAQYAAEDLGRERGYERVSSVAYGGGKTGNNQSSNWGINQNKQWYDRPIHSHTELLNQLHTASKERGIEGRAKSPEGGPNPWPFQYPGEVIDAIPRRRKEIAEYLEWEPKAQRFPALSDEERRALLGKDAEPV